MMPFGPTDFTQVNHQINSVLVSRALRLLEVQPHERVIDWFCGLGNFTLPIARTAREVLASKAARALVQRSRENAQRNDSKPGLVRARNLFELPAADTVAYGAADKWLVDPPREGAFALAKALANCTPIRRPRARLAGAAAHRLRECGPVHAGARRRAAGAPGPATAAWRRGGEHVPAHGACGVDGGVRARFT